MKLVTTLILNIIFTGLAVLLAWKFVPGVELANIEAAFVVAGLIAMATWLVGWILHRTTTPSTFLFGLISFLATSFFIFMVAQRYEDFALPHYWAALPFTALLTLVQIVTGVKRD